MQRTHSDFLRQHKSFPQVDHQYITTLKRQDIKDKVGGREDKHRIQDSQAAGTLTETPVPDSATGTANSNSTLKGERPENAGEHLNGSTAWPLSEPSTHTHHCALKTGHKRLL